ncbi:4Fe-4S binding protein [Hydrogenispora ethanolica]|uniref:4Fe-4S binding protein n=1 Tax=Hydrogenispora ethanolica TaxID=1082276 RepID=A0A4R1RME2_HYDET|nr:DUF4032 domain-containing protein [Hydrogenispora ethanolica]TCL67443.1 4Fe-4S binding protein [Hydrogenispora ethanolica]
MFTAPRRNTFKEIYEAERLSEILYHGVQPIEVAQIEGSVNRWREFDRQFRPERADKGKLRSVIAAMEQEVVLPPISVYKIRDDYYVIDGNHRVSAAKQIEQAYIDAEVQELLPPADSDEHRLWRERSRFEWKTGLKLYLTTNGAYNKLLVYIRLYAKQHLKKTQQPLNMKTAAMMWRDEIYAPVVRMIEARKLRRHFPLYTADDLFVFVIHHQLFKSHLQRRPINPQEAVNDFCNRAEAPSFHLRDLLKGMVLKRPCTEPCFKCSRKCPEGLICHEDGRLMIAESCQGCGACATECPNGNLYSYEQFVDGNGLLLYNTNQKE